jgi:hypothetical protein
MHRPETKKSRWKCYATNQVHELHLVKPFLFWPTTSDKNGKICLMKLVTWDMIFSSVVIPEVSLILLIPKVAVIQRKRKTFWALCISHMWRYFRKVQTCKESWPSSRLNMLLLVPSWKPGQKGNHNRQHVAPMAFPMYMAEATLTKQADL